MQSQEREPRARKADGRGKTNGRALEESALDLRRLLRALQAVRDGDFSVRLPGDQTRLAGKVADLTLANERLAGANQMLQAEKTRELEILNGILQRANAELESTNRHLQDEVAERAKAQQALRDADRKKDEFLAMLAHELRNPLAPIANALYLMRTKPSERQLSWSQDLIERQLAYLTRLVDDLLDVSRITRGKIALAPEPIEVATLAERAVETIQPLLQERGHALTLEIPDAPLRVNGDPLRLTQALGNVLANAAKYTERGGHILLEVARNGPEIEIRVRDDGIGIPPERLPLIFDFFTQLDRSADHPQDGLGIGLALVRRLLEMHGGSVIASSEGAGHGSEFLIRLPLFTGETHLGNGKQSAMRNEAAPAVGRRILVADDNADARESLAEVLRLQGHEIFSAANGTLALEAAERSLPDVALIDIGMPLLDGYEVARRIRAQEWGKQMTLLALTGWGQEADRRRSREAGFDLHLVKPLDVARLTELLATLPTDGRRPPEAGVRLAADGNA